MNRPEGGEPTVVQGQPSYWGGFPGWALGALAALSVLGVGWSAGLSYLRANEFLFALNSFLAGLLVAPVAGVLCWAVSDVVVGMRLLAAANFSKSGAQPESVALSLLSVTIRLQAAALVVLVLLRRAGVNVEGAGAGLLAGGAIMDVLLRVSTAVMICAAVLVAVFRLIVSLGQRQALSGDGKFIAAILVGVTGVILALSRPHLMPAYGLLVAIAGTVLGLRRLLAGRPALGIISPEVALAGAGILVGTTHAVALSSLPSVLVFLLTPLAPPPLVEFLAGALVRGESVLGNGVWLVALMVAAAFLILAAKVAAVVRHLADLSPPAAPQASSVGPTWRAALVGVSAGALAALTLAAAVVALARVGVRQFGAAFLGFAEVSVAAGALLGWLAPLQGGQFLIYLALVWILVLAVPGLDSSYGRLLDHLRCAVNRPAEGRGGLPVGAAMVLTTSVVAALALLVGSIAAGLEPGSRDSAGALIRAALVGQGLGLALLAALVGLVLFRWVLSAEGLRWRLGEDPEVVIGGYGGVRWAYLFRILVVPVALGGWLTLSAVGVRSMLAGASVMAGLVVTPLWVLTCLFGFVALYGVFFLGVWLAIAVPQPSAREPGSIERSTAGGSAPTSTARFAREVHQGSVGTARVGPGPARPELQADRLPSLPAPVGSLEGTSRAAAKAGGGPPSAAPAGEARSARTAPGATTAGPIASTVQTPSSAVSGGPFARTEKVAPLAAHPGKAAGFKEQGERDPEVAAKVDDGGSGQRSLRKTEDINEALFANAKLDLAAKSEVHETVRPAPTTAERADTGAIFSFAGFQYPLLWTRSRGARLDLPPAAAKLAHNPARELSFTLALRASRPEEGFGVWLAGVILHRNVYSCELGRFQLSFGVVREEGGVFTVSLGAVGLEETATPLSREERKSLRELVSRQLVILLRMIRRSFGPAVAPVMTVSASQATVASGSSRNRRYVCPWLLDPEKENGASWRIVWRDSGEDLTSDLGDLPEWIHIVAIGLSGKVVLVGVSLRDLEAISPAPQG